MARDGAIMMPRRVTSPMRVGSQIHVALNGFIFHQRAAIRRADAASEGWARSVTGEMPCVRGGTRPRTLPNCVRRACRIRQLRRAGSAGNVSASSAWPKVCPKFKIRPRSDSRSSAKRLRFDAHRFFDDVVQQPLPG